jgi:protein STU2
VEKGLTGRPAAQQKAQEAILLYIELDKPDPIIEELLPLLSHKQPKVIKATLDALTQIYHAYGCRTVDPKPVLKALPKVYGHADKNVRAAGQNLTVEIYRWLKESMKPLFWNDLKPVQQQDLDKLFEKVKDEPAPKQERLLKSQQAVKEREAASAAADDGDAEGDDGGAEEEEMDLELAINVMPKVPKDLQERLASSKWKDRKEALDDLHQAINVPKMEEGPFDDIIRSLAKCMKDANIMVVIVAANCVEIFAKGLRKSFTKYRSTVMNPMIERLKEKKQNVTDAIGNALDAVFLSTGLSDCLEEILEGLKHKNPQVKLETTKFLIRVLKTTKEAPDAAQVKSMAEASTKLLTESQEVQRNAGAEVLGTLWKIMGDRIMNAHLDGLDDIRKTKIKEYMESAEVKAKFKPKSAAPPPRAAAGAGPAARKPAPGGAKKPALGSKKPAPVAKAPPSPPPEPEPAPQTLAPRLSSKPGVSKLAAPKSGLAPPGGLSRLQKKTPGLPTPASSGIASSPRRPVSQAPPPEEPAPAPAAPKLGLGGLAPGRGLAGRPLAKPTPNYQDAAPVPSQSTPSMSAPERLELEELRIEVERLRRQNEDLRTEKNRLNTTVAELQMSNAQLIEEQTRNTLSIKAKETQLVRARSDVETAEQTLQQREREIERLKRELSRQVRATSPPPYDIHDQILADTGLNGGPGGRNLGDSGYGGDRIPSNGPLFGAARSRAYGAAPTSPNGEGKENIDSVRSSKLSPGRPGSGIGLARSGSSASANGRGGRATPTESSTRSTSGSGTGAAGITGSGTESWKRAAEVTQNLKARIEMMKVSALL